MQIYCPKCKTGYSINPDVIPENGRKLRCAVCGNVFRCKPEDLVQGSKLRTADFTEEERQHLDVNGHLKQEDIVADNKPLPNNNSSLSSARNSLSAKVEQPQVKASVATSSQNADTSSASKNKFNTVASNSHGTVHKKEFSTSAYGNEYNQKQFSKGGYPARKRNKNNSDNDKNKLKRHTVGEVVRGQWSSFGDDEEERDKFITDWQAIDTGTTASEDNNDWQKIPEVPVAETNTDWQAQAQTSTDSKPDFASDEVEIIEGHATNSDNTENWQKVDSSAELNSAFSGVKIKTEPRLDNYDSSTIDTRGSADNNSGSYTAISGDTTSQADGSVSVTVSQQSDKIEFNSALQPLSGASVPTNEKVNMTANKPANMTDSMLSTKADSDDSIQPEGNMVVDTPTTSNSNNEPNLVAEAKSAPTSADVVSDNTQTSSSELSAPASSVADHSNPVTVEEITDSPAKETDTDTNPAQDNSAQNTASADGSAPAQDTTPAETTDSSAAQTNVTDIENTEGEDTALPHKSLDDLEAEADADESEDVKDIFKRLSAETDALFKAESEEKSSAKVCNALIKNMGLKNPRNFKYYYFAILSLLLLSCYYFRFSIVRSFPSVAPVYEFLNIKAQVVGEGLEFQNITRREYEEDAVSYMEIKGYIVNLTNRTMDIPTIYVELLDKDARLIQDQKVTSAIPIITQKGRVAFEFNIKQPSSLTKYIYITFIEDK